MAGDLGSISAKMVLDISEFSSNLDKASKKATDTANKANSKASQLAGKMTSTGKKLTASLTVPIVGFMGTCTKLAMNTQTSFAKVNSIAKQSGDSWTKYSNQMKQGANDMGMAYSDYAEATYQAISAGVKHTDTVKFLDKANKLAVGGFTDLTKATDVLTTIQNAYGLSTKDTSRISDVLIQTQNKGKTTVDELAGAMGRVIPTAKSQGVSIEQLGASYAIMTAEGIQTAEATTYMNNMFNELGRSGTKASDVLKEVSGKSFKELMDSGKSVGDVLQMMKNYADENNMSLTDLFGSAEAGKAALSLLGEGAEKFNGQLDGMKSATGATDEAFKEMSSTAEFKLKQAMSNLKNAMSDFGEALIPIVTDVAEAAAKFFKWASEVARTHPHLTKIAFAIAGVLAVIGPLLMIVGGAINGFLALKGAVVFAKGAFTVISTFIKGKLIGVFISLWLTMAANPITWVVLAIVALVGAFIYCWKNVDGFKEFWINAWNKIKEWCGNAVDWIGEKFNQFKTWLSELPQNVSNFVDNVVQWFSQLPERIWEWLVNTINRISEWVVNLWNKGVEAGSQFLQSVITWFSQLPGRIWEWLVNTITSVAQWADQMIERGAYAAGQFVGSVIAFFIQLPGKVWEWLVNTCIKVYEWGMEMYNSAVDTGTRFLNAIVEWFSQLPGRIWDWCVNAWNKVVEWSQNMYNKATDTGSKFLNAIVEWFSQLPGKVWNWLVNAYNKAVQWGQNMYTKARDAGSRFLQGVNQFLQQLPGKVWNWFTQTIQKAIKWAQDFARKGQEGAKNMAKNVVNGIKNLPSSVASIGKNIVQGLWNGISGMGGWLFGKVKTFAKGVLDSMKGALGIHSPSREMRDQVGKWVTRGVGVGIMDEYSWLQKRLEKMSYNIVSTLQVEQSDLANNYSPLLNLDNQRLVPAASSTTTNQVIHHTTKIDLHVGTFINRREQDIEGLMEQMYEYDRDRKYAKGEVRL